MGVEPDDDEYASDDEPMAVVTWIPRGFGSRRFSGEKNITGITLPQTNSSHLKMDGGKTSFLFGKACFEVLC